LEITNFEEEYEGETNEEKWEKVKEKVEMMRRTSEEEEKDEDEVEYVVTTAHVSLVISDRAVREIGYCAFEYCVNLWKIKTPFVEEVGEGAFSFCGNLVEVVLPNANAVGSNAFNSCLSLRKVALPSARSIGNAAFGYCYDLRHITLHPDVEVDVGAFVGCRSLEILAASANFEAANFDTGDSYDPTRGITRYLHWRNSMDQRREFFYKTIVLLKLANPPPPESTIPARATTSDPIMNFLAEKGCGEIGFAHHLLSFCPQFQLEKRGKGDLRGATKAELLAVGLELKVLRKEHNDRNQDHWGVRLHANGEFIGSEDEESEDEELEDEESDDE
jgi:hypothetical protein